MQVLIAEFDQLQGPALISSIPAENAASDSQIDRLIRQVLAVDLQIDDIGINPADVFSVRYGPDDRVILVLTIHKHISL